MAAYVIVAAFVLACSLLGWDGWSRRKGGPSC